MNYYRNLHFRREKKRIIDKSTLEIEKIKNRISNNNFDNQ